jgi:two-component system CheB/CheR fusion protein
VELPPNLLDVQKQAERIILANYAPAGVVINAEMEVLQFRGRTGPYIEHAEGEATLNLLKMARDSLGIDLRAAVSKCMKQQVPVRKEAARVKQNGGFTDVTIDVVPFQVPPSRERFYLILLESSRHLSPEEAKKSSERKQRARRPDAELNRLRDELGSTRDSLQAIIEEQEATNEELRSANEEIMSSNEELQSTNEELDTAKEELQSTNEELNTVNEELHGRNDELSRVNSDLVNLVGSVQIAIVMVSTDLRIRRFTPMAERILNLIPADLDRSIGHINPNIDGPTTS